MFYSRSGKGDGLEGRVDNFNSKAAKLLQTAYGMSCFSKVFPSGIGRSLHYERAVLCEVHGWFFFLG